MKRNPLSVVKKKVDEFFVKAGVDDIPDLMSHAEEVWSMEGNHSFTEAVKGYSFSLIQSVRSKSFLVYYSVSVFT